jgi:hypothetical protein
MYGVLTDLAIAFVAAALLTVMVDQIEHFLETVLAKVPFLPDAFEWTLTYLGLWGLATGVCWQGDFDLFRALNFQWEYAWEGHVLTGALIAGGSRLLTKQFKVVGLIPGIVTGMASMFGFGGSATMSTEMQDDPEIHQSDN